MFEYTCPKCSTTTSAATIQSGVVVPCRRHGCNQLLCVVVPEGTGGDGVLRSSAQFLVKRAWWASPWLVGVCGACGVAWAVAILLLWNSAGRSPTGSTPDTQIDQQNAAQEEAEQRARQEAEERAAREAREKAAREDALAAAKAEQERKATNQTVIPLDGQASNPAGDQPPWAHARRQAVEQDGVRVRVADLQTDGNCLQVHVRIENRGARDRELRPWSTTPAEGMPRLLDDAGGSYRRLLPQGDRVAGAPKLVPRGQEVTDVVEFITPPDTIALLRLELPGSAFGGKGQLRLELPQAFILFRAPEVFGAKVLPELRQALDDPSPEVRAAGAQALAKLGRIAAPATADLARALKDGKEEVRLAACRALERIGVQAKLAWPSLLGALGDPSDKVARAAGAALAQLPPAAKSDVPALAEALRHKNVRLRAYAARCLKKLGPEARGAFPALLLTLSDADEEVRAAASQALDSLGRFDAADLPVIQTAAADKSVEVRGYAIQTLGRMGPNANAAAATLADALGDKDVHVRKKALVALRAVAPESVVQALIARVLDREAEVRGEAAEALGAMGADAKPAANVLSGALGDADVEVGLKVARALWNIEPQVNPRLTKTLRESLKTGTAATRKDAAEMLGLLGSKAADAVPALADALRDSNAEVRAQAAEALGKFGSEAEPAVPGLIKALRDEKAHDAATNALAAIGKSAVPALNDALDEKDAGARLGAAVALGKIGPDAQAASRSLNFVRKKDEVPKVRQAAEAAYQAVQQK